MKDKGITLLLAFVAAGLAVALVVAGKKAADERKDAADKLTVASNNVTSVKKSLVELQTVNQTLESKLASLSADYSNKLALSEANLRDAEANLEKVVSEAKAETNNDAALIAQRDKKISELESQNQGLDKEDADLRAAITNLQGQIAFTQGKLEKAGKDRDLLLSELKTLQAKKDDLEKQFNSIAAVREQLRKLKLTEVLARRLDWMRLGIYMSLHEKGGQRLMDHSAGAAPAGSAGATVDLRQHGGATIHESPPTNAPAK